VAGGTEVLGENLPQCALSATNPTWLEPGSNPGRRGGKPANDHLSYGTATWGPVTQLQCNIRVMLCAQCLRSTYIHITVRLLPDVLLTAEVLFLQRTRGFYTQQRRDHTTELTRCQLRLLLQIPASHLFTRDHQACRTRSSLLLMRGQQPELNCM
jgi:hypothetical protein